MKTAFLYIRVSTDEQADTGYSQRYQEETLRRFCDIKGITVKEIFFEDHSAKTFQRPEWTRLMLLLRKHRGIADIVLFTKWDRFSRNTADAYGMITTLTKLGVDQQAIEQPLDLSIPENKLMLAFYLAAPEVENDRRSLNIVGGMRRARKEGRWMGTAPPGYKNKIVDGKKSIVVCEQQGPAMRWVFEELAKGVLTARSVMIMAQQKGLVTRSGKPICKASFWAAIRNPAYYGYIRVQSSKGEEEQLVRGQHAPLISEGLFYQVQDVLDGKKKKMRVKQKLDDRFPLRGFLLCPQCGKILTASSSKGRTQHYHYYHCFSGCNVRFPSDTVNGSFEREIGRWKPHPAVGLLYKQVLQDMHREGNKVRQTELKRIQEDLARQEAYKTKIRKLRIAEELDADDYRAEKKECEENIIRLETQMALLVDGPDLQPQLEQAYGLLSNIDTAYQENDIQWKQDFIGSMFPEKLEFTGSGFRTARVNEVARLIYSLGAAFTEVGAIEKAAFPPLGLVSCPTSPLFEPLFIYDLRNLSRLYKAA